ncbi:Adenylate isopentenyltransferase [Musa troglodytarum]|uniref:Adenylate isopentenyltransferase n=1 Tax=Musa troglodytarum TaxID=320322 RepID=A0A9E7JD10_9LILI|nr:Adenylate isopentenyltransferase [Musa troglodytarum]
MRILLNGGGSRAILLPRLQRPPVNVKQQRAVTTAVELRPQRSHHLHDWYCGNGYSGNGSHGQGKEEEQRVVVIMGATGTGKSKLSVDLSVMFSGEVVNSDKIQVYRGLDITTNKIPVVERRGVPHHLLGELDPAAGELPPVGFRALAERAIGDISARRRVPVLAGGSNSFIHALLSDRVTEVEGLRYRCCLLWVHVEAAVLAEHLDRRVDEMVGEGMVEELEGYFTAEGKAERHPGLGKAIGVPEFRGYFTGRGGRTAAAYEAAVTAIKSNTRRLAEEQVRKIERLAALGWPLRLVNATNTVAARLAGEGAAAATAPWRRDVAGPSEAAVEQFLENDDWRHRRHRLTRTRTRAVPPPIKVC